MFHAKYSSGKRFEAPTSKVVCVGRNYAEHAKELNNPIPDSPILFIKPETSLVNIEPSFVIPASDCHYEAEIAILIGKELNKASFEHAQEGIAGVGLAMDLTKRSLQSQLKKKGHPWEISKAFDGSCPLSQFIPISAITSLESITFSLSINEEIKQKGIAKDMITPIVPLIIYISEHFTLRAGDIVLTGTPQGVGELFNNDKIELTLLDDLHIKTQAVTF